MNDFKLVINSYFNIVIQVFNLIVSNWFLSFCFLVCIFGFIISLFNKVKGDE